MAQKKKPFARLALSRKRSWSLSFVALLDDRVPRAGRRADGLIEPFE